MVRFGAGICFRLDVLPACPPHLAVNERVGHRVFFFLASCAASLSCTVPPVALLASAGGGLRRRSRGLASILVSPCLSLSHLVPPCPALSHLVPPCLTLSYLSHLVLPCLTLSHLVSPCPTLSHLVSPCLALSTRLCSRWWLPTRQSPCPPPPCLGPSATVATPPSWSGYW